MCTMAIRRAQIVLAGAVKLATLAVMDLTCVRLSGLYVALEQISIAQRATAVAPETPVHHLEKPVQVVAVHSVLVTKRAVAGYVYHRRQHVVGITIVIVERRVAPMGERVVVARLGPMCAARITAAAKKGVHVRSRPRKMKLLLEG